jgi:hypothetical protein
VYATIEGCIQILPAFIRFRNNKAAFTPPLPYSNHATAGKYSIGFHFI